MILMRLCPYMVGPRFPSSSISHVEAKQLLEQLPANAGSELIHARLSQLRTFVQSQEFSLQNYQASLLKLEETQANLQISNEKHLTKIDDLKHHIIFLQRQTEELGALRSLDELRGRALAQATQQMNNLRLDITTRSNEIDSYQRRQELFENELSNIRQASITESERLRQEVAHLRALLSGSTRTLDENQARAQASLQATEAKLSLTEEALSQLQHRDAELKTKWDALRNLHVQTLDKLRELETIKAQDEHSLNALSAQRDKDLVELHNCREEITMLQEQLADAASASGPQLGLGGGMGSGSGGQNAWTTLQKSHQNELSRVNAEHEQLVKSLQDTIQRQEIKIRQECNESNFEGRSIHAPQAQLQQLLARVSQYETLENKWRAKETEWYLYLYL